MNEGIDLFHYIRYVRSQWRWIGASSTVAVLLALVISLSIERQYTAVTQIVIEPPAGTDLRTSLTVSPVYLESLKTYEHFAGGDQLFEKAMNQFHLRGQFGSRPIESIKKRVLRTDIVRNTRILEIAVTLPQPDQALELARYLAQATVDLNRSAVEENDRALVDGIARQQHDARTRLDALDAAWARLAAEKPVEDLQIGIGKGADLRSAIEQQIQAAQVEAADAADRAKHTEGAQRETAQQEAAEAGVRIRELQRQAQELGRENEAREKTLGARMAERSKAEADRKEAQTALAGIEARLRDARSEAGYRGDRLKIIDPGVVPERPSAPNVPLNVAAALLAGIALPILFLALTLNFQEQRARGRISALRPIAKGIDG